MSPAPPPDGGDGTTAPTGTYYSAPEQEVIKEEVMWLSFSVGLCLLYLVLRKWAPSVVVLRHSSSTRNSSSNNNGIRTSLLTNEQQPTTESLWQQIFNTLFMSEKDFIARCGLDAYLTLRLVNFAVVVTTAFAFAGLLFLAPVYHNQERTRKCDEYCAAHNKTSPPDAYRADCVCGFIDSCSLALVPKESNVLWFCAMVMGYVSCVALYALRVEYKEVVRLRRDFFLTRPNRIYSVFVDRIPRSLSSPALLKEYFEKLFPGKVHSVDILAPVDALKRVGEQRAKALRLLERAIVQEKDARAVKTSSPTAIQHHWTFDFSRNCLKRVPSVAFYAKQLEECNERFIHLREQFHETFGGDDDAFDIPRQAFVTFNSAGLATTASQALVQENMVIKPAPDPLDVRWNTLGVRNTAFSHFVRKTLSRILFGLLVLFWGALTSLVSALTSTEALARQFPSLNRFLLENPTFVDYLDRLTTLTYVILIALPFPLIGLLVQSEVRISQSNVERATTERYFLFLVVQVFVFYSVAGTVFKSMVDLAQNPSHIVNTLASTIPINASFFVLFVTIKIFWLFFDLVRGYNFINHLLRLILYGRSVTPRERRWKCCCCWDFWHPAPMGLASCNANLLLVFFIATSYACIQPLLLFVAMLYFLAARFTLAFIITTSSLQIYDGGGTAWTHTFWCIVASIITAQLTLTGTLLTKSGFGPAVCTLIMSGVTLVTASHIQDKYRDAATRVTVELAAKLDQDIAAEARVMDVIPPVFQYGIMENAGDALFLSARGVQEWGNSPRQQPQPLQREATIKTFKYRDPVLLEPLNVGGEVLEEARMLDGGDYHHHGDEEDEDEEAEGGARPSWTRRNNHQVVVPTTSSTTNEFLFGGDHQQQQGIYTRLGADSSGGGAVITTTRRNSGKTDSEDDEDESD